jgi:N4-gp56 family major capsid protein
MALSTGSNTVKTAYSRMVERNWFANSFFAKMVGAMPTAETPDLGIPMAGRFTPIVLKAELLREGGDTVQVPKYSPFTASATSDNLADGTDLESNESAMSDSQLAITPVERGKAVAWRSRNDLRTAYSMREVARDLLGGWAGEKFDADVIEIAEAGTTNVVYSNDATERSDIDASDTLAVLDLHKAVAKLENEKAQIPGGMGGGYIAIVHPYSLYNLKRDSDWSNYHQNASVRGEANPLFKHPKLVGWIDNIAIFESTLISRAANGNTPAVQVALNLVLSARCLAVAALMGTMNGSKFGNVWEWRERSQKDYGRLIGVGIIADYEAALLFDEHICRIELIKWLLWVAILRSKVGLHQGTLTRKVW